MPRLPSLHAPLTPHPISDRAYWQGVVQNPLHADWLKNLEARATAFSAQPPAILASDFLAARRENNRERSDVLLRNLRNGVATLAMWRCVQGPVDTDDRLIDWLWAQLQLSCWAMISHLPDHDLPRMGEAYIDLGASMTALVLAETRELLLPWLEQQSGTLAASILHRLDTEILTPFATGATTPWWSVLETVHNNWTGVCAGSILTVCNSLARQDEPRPAAKAKALALVNRYLHKGFTPDGECDEGPGYWSYGLIYACTGLSGLNVEERATALDLERLQRVAQYPQRAHLFGTTFYASNDAAPSVRPSRQCIGWLAAICDDPFLHGWAACDNHTAIDHAGLNWRSLFITEALAAETAPAWPPVPPPLVWLADQQAAVFRRTITGHEWAVSLAGGDNAEAHNHNDLGHVNIWIDHEPLLVDIGRPVYGADNFGPKRYTYLANNSLGHNVPVIAGQAQRSGHDARCTVLTGPDAQGMSLELHAAYDPAVGCRRWERTLRLHDDHVDIIDEAELPAHTSVELRWWTTREPVLTAHGARIGALVIENPGCVIALRQENAADHRLPDGQLWCVSMTAQADAQGVLRLTTTCCC